MFRCDSGQGHGVADGFVESVVSSAPEQHRLVHVVHVVLDVTHFVVDGDKILHVHLDAQLHPAESWFRLSWRKIANTDIESTTEYIFSFEYYSALFCLFLLYSIEFE